MKCIVAALLRLFMFIFICFINPIKCCSAHIVLPRYKTVNSDGIVYESLVINQ